MQYTAGWIGKGWQFIGYTIVPALLFYSALDG